MAGYWEPPPLSFMETSEVPQHKGESMEFGAGTVDVGPWYHQDVPVSVLSTVHSSS